MADSHSTLTYLAALRAAAEAVVHAATDYDLDDDIHGLDPAVGEAVRRLDAVLARLSIGDWAQKPLSTSDERREPSPECTGIAATWCPAHGNCSCRPKCCEDYMQHEGRGWRCAHCDLRLGPQDVEAERNDPECPLHSDRSSHGEQPPSPPTGGEPQTQHEVARTQLRTWLAEDTTGGERTCAGWQQALDAAKHAMADVRPWLDLPEQAEPWHRLGHAIAEAERMLLRMPLPLPPSEPEWQPITTAPKDRTRVLLLGVDGGVEIGHWDGEEWLGDDGYQMARTHWMPLPSPPSETPAQEGR